MSNWDRIIERGSGCSLGDSEIPHNGGTECEGLYGRAGRGHPQFPTPTPVPMDARYTTLLNLLQRPNETLKTLTDETIHGAIAHYLSLLPLVQLPIFVRTLITSQTLWHSRKWDHLSGAHSAVRQAVKSKHANIVKTTRPGFLADPDIATPLKEWISAVLLGQSTATSSFQHLHVRISLLGGLIQGLEDIRAELPVNRLRKNVYDQLATTSPVLLTHLQSLSCTTS